MQDPWPDEANEVFNEVVVGGDSRESAIPDSLVGVDNGKDAPGPCVAEKNDGLVEDGRDKVVVVGGDGCEERGKCHGVSSFQPSMNSNLQKIVKNKKDTFKSLIHKSLIRRLFLSFHLNTLSYAHNVYQLL